MEKFVLLLGFELVQKFWKTEVKVLKKTNKIKPSRDPAYTGSRIHILLNMCPKKIKSSC